MGTNISQSTPVLKKSGSTAVVFLIGDRYFCKFGKGGSVQTAWSLAGARFFGDWNFVEIDELKTKLISKGKNPVAVLVGAL